VTQSVLKRLQTNEIVFDNMQMAYIKHVRRPPQALFVVSTDPFTRWRHGTCYSCLR